MEVRKYLFWMTDRGIQTYKAVDDGSFELIRFKGEDICADMDLKKFWEWFNKMASIAGDEYIDFCYLSDKPVKFPIVDYGTKAKSSWNKQEIASFCSKYINVTNYEVMVDDEHSFVCQSGNIFDKEKVKKLYLECIPEFVLETTKEVNVRQEETSLVCRYFIDMLRELDKK
ncbi:MAG: hypothetical protein NC416_13130 [Eubacterium sp.]|nr:hypothetical protein [Eubacterium sp.]